MLLLSFPECEIRTRPNRPGPNLFSHSGIELPERLLLAPNDGQSSSLERRSPIIRVPQSVDKQVHSQLELPFSVSNIIDFIPKNRLEYLNYSISIIERKSRILKSITRKLARYKILYVGDLITKNCQFLENVVGLEVSETNEIERVLFCGGLRLNMSIPYWSHPLARPA
jgi:hypothetical protein